MECLRGWQQSGGEGNSDVRGGNSGGSTVGGRQPLGTALHTISIRHRPFIPFLSTKSQKRQTKNRSSKNFIKHSRQVAGIASKEQTCVP